MVAKEKEEIKHSLFFFHISWTDFAITNSFVINVRVNLNKYSGRRMGNNPHLVVIFCQLLLECGFLSLV